MRALFLVLSLASLSAGCAGPSAAQGGASNDGPPPIDRVDRLEVRRVWSGVEPNLYVASPSPDGRLVTEIDWRTGDLAVRDLEKGSLRRVTDKGPWADSGDFAEYSVFSADGERIAFTWFSQESGGFEVRTIRPDGSDMRIVMPRRPEFVYMAVEDWSRDGASILLTVFRADGTAQIGILSLRDGSFRPLKTTDYRNPVVSAFSPDGRYVAFDFPVSASADQRDIFLVPAGGGPETSLVTGPFHESLLGWLPDGQGIVYHARTPESRAIFALRVKDGRAVGSPQLLRPDAWQVQPLGFSRDALFYGVDVEGSQVHVASVDLAGGRPLGPGRPISDPTYSRGWDPAWGPDGQMVAHLAMPGGGSGRRLELRSASGELRRHFPLPVTFNPRKLDWLPDGSAVLLYGADLQGRRGIHRLALADGTLEPLVTHPPTDFEGMAFYAVSPDRTTVYHRSGSKRPPLYGDQSIVAHDLRTGATREIVQTGAGRGITVSPDGKLLAYTLEDMKQRVYKVMVLPVAGGEPRAVYSPADRVIDNNWRINWAPDGESLVVYDSPADRPAGVWQVPIDGSAPRLLLERRQLSASAAAHEGLRPNNLRLSPDGRRIAYEIGRYRGEIWAIGGFAPFPVPPGRSSDQP